MSVMNKNDNKLANFTLMDLHDMIDKINNEEASNQANLFMNRLENYIRNNAKNNIKSMKFISFSDNNSDIIHNSNIKYLSNNGFKVWKMTHKFYDQNNKKKIYCNDKHFISWTIDDSQSFKNEIFDNDNYNYLSKSPNHIESTFQELS